MKYLLVRLLTIVSLILATTNSFSQGWQWQNPRPFGDPIIQLFFVDAQHGWAVPENTTLVRTLDGGKNWEILYTNLAFNDIFFIDSLEGWGIARAAFFENENSIYHTIDGGESWELQLSGTGVRHDIFFLDHNHGWATGRDFFGLLLHTCDGGETWVRQAEGEFSILDETYGVMFLDTLKGWAVGGMEWGIYTTDAGQTWTRDSTLASIHYLTHTDSLHLWGLSDYWFGVRSTDGGNTWERFEYADRQNENGETRGREIIALDNERVFIAATNGIYSSTDGGVSWQPHSEQSLNSFQFLSDEEVFGGGDQVRARLLHSLDSAKTWTNLITTNNLYGFEIYTDIDFIDMQTGWLTGSIVPNLGGFILKTSDGGNNWQEQFSTADPGKTPGIIHFLDEMHGWAGGGGGLILRTIDGGQNWLLGNSGTSFGITDIAFLNTTEGWAVGRAFTANGFEGVIIHTTDGGANWTDQTPGQTNGLFGVSFVDSLYGWVVGGGSSSIDPGSIMHTFDGGQTWVVQRQHPDMVLDGVQFLDRQHGWVYGYDPQTNSTILYTSDGGNNWVGLPNSSELISDMKFLNHQVGWTINILSEIFVTTDGGQSWIAQPSYSSQNLNGIDMIDENNGWVVGNWGTILHTTNGGVTGFAPVTEAPVIQQKFIFYPNFPNPFNPETTIRFEIIEQQADVSLIVFDILGRRIRQLLAGQLFSGMQEIRWDGHDDFGKQVSSGIYIVRLQVDGIAKSQKMMLLR